MKPVWKNLIFALSILALATPAAALSWGVAELENEKLAVTLAREVARGGYDLVTTEELKSWMDQGKDMLIVDTMPYEDSFKKNHIRGAVQFEFPIPEMVEMEPSRQKALAELLGEDKDRTIVFYCGFTKCTRSHNGALWARKLGYQNVYRQPGGIKAWRQADYPVEAEK